MMHLLVDISFHGFGHIAQTAPLLNLLRQRVPGLRLTVRCAAPRELLASRIQGDFEHLRRATDFGMVMESAMMVRVAESAAAYREFHRDWWNKVATEAAELAALKPDLILANVSYLALAAARRAGIPALAMCSLNWADIYYPYCGARPEAEEVRGQMLEAYAGAEVFLKPQPAMPMEALSNTRPIGPIAPTGENRRAEVDAKLGLKPGEKLVLVSLGGIDTRLPMDAWPRIPGMRWLAQASWGVRHPDVVEFEKLGMPFIDLVRSCDAMLAKPGYGTFAEAGCNGTPVLYASRGDWPEEPCLVEWLQANGRCREAGRARLESGDLQDDLAELLARAPRPPVLPTGGAEAAEIVSGYL